MGCTYTSVEISPVSELRKDVNRSASAGPKAPLVHRSWRVPPILASKSRWFLCNT